MVDEVKVKIVGENANPMLASLSGYPNIMPRDGGALGF
jgi:hypothetical protein